VVAHASNDVEVSRECGVMRFVDCSSHISGLLVLLAAF
jgi:hypothetical protein